MRKLQLRQDATEWPSLFDFNYESESPKPVSTPVTVVVNVTPEAATPVTVTTVTKTTAKSPAAKVIKNKPVLPDCLKKLSGTVTLPEFMKAAKISKLGYKKFRNNGYSYGHFLEVTTNGNNFINESYGLSDETRSDIIILQDGFTENSRKLLHLAKNGECWACNAQFAEKAENCKKVKLSRWQLCERLSDKVCFVCQDEPVADILKRTKPYLYQFALEHDIELEVIVQAPQIETLQKAGYLFADNLSHSRKHITLRNGNDYDRFNRLCHPGRNPKEIFKTSKAVYTALKNCTELEIWDVYRKLDKFGRIKQDAIQQAYNNNYGVQELESISSVLAKTYNGKPVFTWEALINYLNRIDQYEAIPAKDGLLLLHDYLESCRILNMEPRIDGDSLKREHDIAARLVREHRDEMKAKAMKNAAKHTDKYNYEENVFTIRGIRDYDDLVDEAKQQHNCVASYADKITKGQSLVFVMREKSAPDRSLITIELSPKLEMRQKLLAYNRPIHNKAQTEFIERWLKHCKSVA